MARSSEKSGLLAERLATLVVMLYHGEKLDLKELAKKFNISERTLSRDVDRLRAAHLSIELDEEQKYYLVGGSSNIGFKQADINDFVQLSGIQGLYPSVKASSLKKLFKGREQAIYEAKGYAYEDASKLENYWQCFQKQLRKISKLLFYIMVNLELLNLTV